ncbi:3-keto-disaccharide hydrolase [Fodinibius sediminis]|uniref:3-keto-alpha-glucoside-1,2-lyase/3-keto-2-hydroxy-glucal hydratase domain-containing protein n=1 Tax=Fodinibius sediminis TaxID=1214077 RepID=A0A521F2L1_9BACT|nr:DUF1080 domain-containing protein [Fodinibius sediminis]SMO90403.1 protein of unknown function [Fodinibius sediminis]
MKKIVSFQLSIPAIVLLLTMNTACAQQQDMKPEETEVWKPIPGKVDPNGFNDKAPPSDAIVLFDGSDLDEWESAGEEGAPAEWNISGDHLTVAPGTGSIQTKQGFGSVQLHVEWRSPEKVEGEGQGRGNSGIFLQGKYELQVLDSYNNETYSNGMAGSIYKQHIPLVNAAREPGEWQSYDIIYTAPEFEEEGRLKSPARITVFWNGVLVQDDVEIEGPTEYIGHPSYEVHEEKLPIMLQDHSNPVSYRNIWLRELDK